MPKFSFSVPHSKGREDAKKNLRAYIDKSREYMAKNMNDMKEDWSAWDTDNKYAFSFNTFGFNIAGAMTVADDAVKVDGEIPFAAVMFKGKIEQGFKDLVDKALA
jgi:hypothetical protein